MAQSTNNEQIVKWHQLQGNIYLKALHPAMISTQGFLSTHKARLIGTSKFCSQYVTVNYDQEYVIAWLASKVIKPFQNLGKDGIVSLVEQAWELSRKPKTFIGNQLEVDYSSDEQI
jgi:hypothetical protein